MQRAFSYIRYLAAKHQPAPHEPTQRHEVCLNIEPYLGCVPLTGSQRSAVEKLAAGVNKGGLAALCRGETGAGKTHVAIPLLAAAAAAAPPSLLVAPTKLLVEQHAKKLQQALPGHTIGVWTSEEKQPGDILVATQAATSYPGTFALTIIDEEQRFGAAVKARLAGKSSNIIYLTATPIPRTHKHCRMTPVIIEGYPVRRIPPKVFTGRFKERVCKRLILRELGRGGQVIYVHHPISELDDLKKNLSRIPGAKVAVLHGRLPTRDVLGIAAAFRNGEYNILLTTSIIESGLDLPRVNTLICDCSQVFGLLQLHQFLGRVGRHGERCWAYLAWQGEPSCLAKWRCLAAKEKAYTVCGWDARLRGSGLPGKTAQTGHFLTRLEPHYWEYL